MSCIYGVVTFHIKIHIMYVRRKGKKSTQTESLSIEINVNIWNMYALRQSTNNISPTPHLFFVFFSALYMREL